MASPFEGPQPRIEGTTDTTEVVPAQKPRLIPVVEVPEQEQERLVSIIPEPPKRPPRSVPHPEGQATAERLPVGPVTEEERLFGADQARRFYDSRFGKSRGQEPTEPPDRAA